MVLKRKNRVCTKCLLLKKYDSNNCIGCYQKRNLPELYEQKPAFNFSSLSLEPHVPVFSSISNNFIFGSIISSESSNSQTVTQSIQVDISDLAAENNHNHSNNTSASQILELDTLAQAEKIITSKNKIPKYTSIQAQCHSDPGVRTIFLRSLPLSSESKLKNNNIENTRHGNNLLLPRNILEHTNASTSILPRRADIIEETSSTSSVFDNLSLSNIYNLNYDLSTNNSSISSSSSSSSNTNTLSLTRSTLTAQSSTNSTSSLTRRVNPRDSQRRFLTILRETFSYSIIGRSAIFSFIFCFFIIMFFYILFLYISSHYNF